MSAKRTISEIINSLRIPKLKETPHGYKGCCMINEDHIDSSPSMHIHLEKGHVKCFSCGAYKPLFTFLIDNGVSFDEAIEFMFTDYTRETQEDGGLKEYYLGRKIPKSMIDRGFAIKTLKHFEVGYDEFEHHTTIPLRYPIKGALIGIQFRQFPKKLWATDNFNKDNFIYNFAPTPIRIYTEGFTDTWRIWQNGYEDVSATLSANPSDGQLAIMSQHKEIWMAYDNDEAGFRGAFKVHKELGRNTEIKMIPFKATDAGECSKEIWEAGIRNMTSFTEFEVAMITKNPELYARITKKLY
jgi:DNA primase